MTYFANLLFIGGVWILLIIGSKGDVVNSTEPRDELSVRRLYDKIFATLNSPENYDRRIRPFLGVKPVAVTVFIRVLSLRSISEATMDYRLELFFREKWQDPRLAYDQASFDNISEISLHESLTERLWMPDTFIPNAVKSRNPNRESVTHRSLLRLNPDGNILFSRRLSITAECPMDLTLYPFDGHGINEVLYEWLGNSKEAVKLDNLQLPDYQLKRVVTRSHNVTVATGTYSRLECCFFFVRSAGFYFMQLFLPATAIVLTSWLLLSMGRGSNFSDMIEIILAVTFLYFSYTAMMPRVSYVKAMDVYLGACFLHVFACMAKMAATKYYEANYEDAPKERRKSAPKIVVTENDRNELTPENDARSNSVSESPIQEKKFRYKPTNSNFDVMATASMISGKKKSTPKNSSTCTWKQTWFEYFVRFVARVPNNILLFSFLIFWAVYLLVCLVIVSDTNEDRCQFKDE